MNKRSKKYFGIDPVVLYAFITQLIIFSAFAYFRFIAFDEGFYALASKKVSLGEFPYLDFFYPQTPLLPFIYGAWLKLFGYHWISARALSVILTALVGTFVFIRSRSVLEEKMPIGAVLLFVFSGMTAAWFVTVKTYALTIFLLFSSYLFLSKGCREEKPWSWVLAGLFLGLAVQVRLMMLVLIAVYLYYGITRRVADKPFRMQILPLLAGFTVSLAPSLYFLLQDFDLFWFNNLGYHFIRKDLAFWDSLQQKISIAKTIFGIAANKEYSSFQLLILMLLSAVYGVLGLVRRKKLDPALPIAVAVLIVSFLPSPSWAQYFSVLVPFLVVLALLSFREIFSSYLSEKKKKILAGIAVLVVIGYVVDGVFDISRYAVTGERVLTVDIKGREASRLASISEVSDSIDRYAAPGTSVLSIWPGFLFESHSRPVSGMENQFWFRVYNKLKAQEIDKYKLMSKKKLRSIIAKKLVDVVVFEGRKKYFSKKFLNQKGYQQVETKTGAAIYSKESDES